MVKTHLPQIDFKTIPHAHQRYRTVGDYFRTGDSDTGPIAFRISEMENPDYEFLVLVHELIEWYLTSKRALNIREIDNFDMKFEELRDSHYDMIGEQEPGDMVSAPYHDEHMFATSIEKLLAHHLNIDWKDYNDNVEEL